MRSGKPPVLFHDPTSEPSRAVHWFALEAGVELELRYVWLTRGEHLSPELLRINPRHQVPALEHGELRLSEATAIMRYLAEVTSCSDLWLGASLIERARVNQLLSWWHTNPRLKITLQYFLPTLLMPFYHGSPIPPEEERRKRQAGFAECLEQLEGLIGDRDYIAGDRFLAPDIVVASDLFALDVDPDRERILEDVPGVRAWLERVRRRPACSTSLRCWNAVVAVARQRMPSPAAPTDSQWVAELCERLLALSGPVPGPGLQ